MHSAAVPIARYNGSFARTLATFVLNACSASRHFYADQLPASSQTDFGDVRNPGAVFPYEALRACDYVRERANCTADSAAPFATGDYGCEYPSFSPECAITPRECPNCTNLCGYQGGSVGVAAALCAPTNVRAVLQSDLLATDAFHAPAFPTFLVSNPHAEAVSVAISVPGCGLVHWATPRDGRAGAAPRSCAVTDASSGAVLARGAAAGGSATIDVPPETALVVVLVPE